MIPRPTLRPGMPVGRLALALVAASLGAVASLRAAPESVPALAGKQTDYAAFLRQNMSPMDDGAREAFIFQWIAGLPPAQWPQVFQQSQPLPEPLRRCVREALLLKWAQTDPGAAWVALCAEPSLDAASAAAFFGAWAELDFAAAWSAANAEGLPELPASVLTPLMVCRARTQPQDAARRALEAGDENLGKTLGAIFQTWGQSDPKAAVDFAIANSCIQKLNEMYADWLARDFDAAYAALESMPQDQREALVERLFRYRALTRSYPETAWKLNDRLLAQNGGVWKKKGLWVNPGWMVNMMPAETFRRCAAIDDPAQRQYAMEDAVTSLCASDANAAFDAFLRFRDILRTPPEEHSPFGLTQRLSDRAPLRMIAIIPALPDKKLICLTQAFYSLEPAEIPQALALLNDPAFAPILAEFKDGDAFAAVARRNPAAVRDWIAGMPDKNVAAKFARMAQEGPPAPAPPSDAALSAKEKEKRAVDRALSSGNARALTDTLRMVAALPPGDPLRGSSVHLVEKLSRMDTPVFVNAMADPDVFDIAFRAKDLTQYLNMVYVFAQRPECVDALAARLDPERARVFLPTACNALAQTDPRAAAAKAETIPPGPERTKVFDEIHEQWMQWDPAQAMQWLCARQAVEGDGEAPPRIERYKQNMRRWAEIDPDAAERWLAGRKTDAVGDALIAGFVRAQSDYDAPLAFQWALRISDAYARLKNAQHAIAAWKSYDAAAAAAAEKQIEPLVKEVHEAGLANIRVRNFTGKGGRP